MYLSNSKKRKEKKRFSRVGRSPKKKNAAPCRVRWLLCTRVLYRNSQWRKPHSSLTTRWYTHSHTPNNGQFVRTQLRNCTKRFKYHIEIDFCEERRKSVRVFDNVFFFSLLLHPRISKVKREMNSLFFSPSITLNRTAYTFNSNPLYIPYTLELSLKMYIIRLKFSKHFGVKNYVFFVSNLYTNIAMRNFTLQLPFVITRPSEVGLSALAYIKNINS